MRKIKICGVKSPEVAEVAAAEGASMLGFVFFDKSPRHLSLDEARRLRPQLPPTIERVALCVDARDEEIGAIVKAIEPQWLQLHGSESPERLADLKHRLKLRMIKALPVGSRQDVEAHHAHAAADMILFDAKPEARADGRSPLPGGSGRAFDWTLLHGCAFKRPWILAGGLDVVKVGDALRHLSPDAVDVSSGVESAPGVKSPQKVRAFIRAAKATPCP